jgi:hypothetical protein
MPRPLQCTCQSQRQFASHRAEIATQRGEYPVVTIYLEQRSESVLEGTLASADLVAGLACQYVVSCGPSGGGLCAPYACA